MSSNLWVVSGELPRKIRCIVWGKVIWWPFCISSQENDMLLLQVNFVEMFVVSFHNVILTLAIQLGFFFAVTQTLVKFAVFSRGRTTTHPLKKGVAISYSKFSDPGIPTYTYLIRCGVGFWINQRCEPKDLDDSRKLLELCMGRCLSLGSSATLFLRSVMY